MPTIGPTVRKTIVRSTVGPMIHPYKKQIVLLYSIKIILQAQILCNELSILEELCGKPNLSK
mgnify:CR=1 FL=1